MTVDPRQADASEIEAVRGRIPVRRFLFGAARSTTNRPRLHKGRMPVDSVHRMRYPAGTIHPEHLQGGGM